MTTPNSLMLPEIETPVSPPPPPAVTLTPQQELINQYDIQDPPPVISVPAAVVEPAVPQSPAAPKPATPPQSPAVPPVVADPKNPKGHPKYLLQQATDFGIPDSVIGAVSADVLGDLVYRETKKVMAEGRGQSIAAARQGDAPPPVAAAATPQTPAAPPAFDWGEVEEDMDGVKVKRKIEETDIHPALASVIKRAFDKIATLEGVIAQAGQQAHAAQERTMEQRMDAFFSSIPRAFGTGGAAQVKGTKEFARRKAVWAAVQETPAEVRGTMTLEDALAKAAEELFGVKAAAAATPPVKPAKPGVPTQTVVEEWNQGIVNKPTNRQAPPKENGRAKAVQTVEQFLADVATGEEEGGQGDVTLNEFL